MVLFHLHDAGFGPKACGYDGAGDPCPASNDAAPELMPLPPGFENSITQHRSHAPAVEEPSGEAATEAVKLRRVLVNVGLPTQSGSLPPWPWSAACDPKPAISRDSTAKDSPGKTPRPQ